MMPMELMIIEDDEKQLGMYKRQIDDLNSDRNLQITYRVFNNREDGLKALDEYFFDAALVDIKLSSSDDDNNANEIIRKIKNKYRFPVRVFTAYADIDEDLKDENEFFRIYDRIGEKSKPIREILIELSDIYETGIVNILGNRGIFVEYIHKLFWGNISKDFKHWVDDKNSGINTEKVLLRYMMAHLIEYLDGNEDGDYDNYHPSEFYISEPINQKYHTGLIIKKKQSEEIFIILSPACDLASKKPKRINLCKIEECQVLLDLQKAHKKTLKSLVEADQSSDSVKKGELTNKLKEIEEKLLGISRNAGSFRYHYLPALHGINGMIDFQHIISVSPEEFDQEYEKVASVTDKFRKDIVARFSAYYGRQGQPSFHPEKIQKLMTQ